jgi:ribonucleoside-diphosphate reductase alpha chain
MDYDTMMNEGKGKFSENALRVLEKRYLHKEGGLVVETPADMLRRVAHHVASAELNYGRAREKRAKAVEEEFFQTMFDLEFLPNSPTLMNAGRDLGQLSACFVLPVDDSLNEIFLAIKHTAKIHQSGGGTGFSFSRLRPKDDLVASTGGVASGPVSFMKVFNAATEAIKQGGTRRGANMGILRVDHPDILEFIQCKRDQKEVTNFNISVAISDEFMRKVEADEEYELINPRSGQLVNKLNARVVFDLIAQAAWEGGDPGVVFIDRINEANPTPQLGEIESTNPCGEQPLLPYESCNLGSINLSKFVRARAGRNEINYERLRKCVRSAVRFLDNVIDVNRYPIENIEKITKANRKIGLGLMGFADLLIMLGIPYDSEEAIFKAREIINFITDAAWEMSAELAKERDCFPNFPESRLAANGGDGKPAPVYKGRAASLRARSGNNAPLPWGYQLRQSPHGFRNATVITIAPTGTIAILADCSSGIEPIFALAYTRVGLDNQKFIYTNRLFETKAKELGIYSRELMEKVATKGSCQGLDEVPEEGQRVFVTAMDIDIPWHIKMQAAFQAHTDNAVSKTLNFPNKATVDDVKEAYRLAYKEGCKGVTIYRDGSREGQVLSVARKKEEEQPALPERTLVPRFRPRVTSGHTERIRSGCGNLYVTINQDEQGLCEVFVNIGKGGGCASAEAEAIGRLVSLALRAGVEPSAIIKHLRGVRCPQPFWDEGELILSCPDAIGRALERLIRHGGEDEAEGQRALFIDRKEGDEPLQLAGACPECGGMMEHESGCAVCRFCGFNRCG